VEKAVRNPHVQELPWKNGVRMRFFVAALTGNARIVTLTAALSGVAGGIIAAFGIQRSL
jgi:hypothetical protein